MHTREHALVQIRLRRALTAGRHRLRRRLPRQQQPDVVRMEYWKAIVGLLARARAELERRLLPQLGSILEEAAHARGDASPIGTAIGAGQAARLGERARINDIFERLKGDFFDATFKNGAADLAQRFAERTADYQGEQLGKQVRAALGVDLSVLEPDVRGHLADFVQENVALIRSIPERYFADVEKLVTRGAAAGMRHEDLAKELRGRYDISARHAKLVARDQVGKLYGGLNQVRQKALGVEQYVWRTVNDNRVRPEHEEREGRSYTWKRPPADGHPGQAINCRCYAEPDFSAILGE